MIPILIAKEYDLVRLYEHGGAQVLDKANLVMWVRDANPKIPTTNGVGRLIDAISCEVTQELNGEYELEMEYPIDGELYDKIRIRDVIVAKPDRSSTNQPFRIYKITKPMDGIVTIYARHIVYDLIGTIVSPFKATTLKGALAGIKSHSMTVNQFTFSTSRTTEIEFEVVRPTSVWDLLGGSEGSLLDVYGGEYTFNGYSITLENTRGSDNGVSVDYGVNMTELEQEEDYSNCYTGVVGYIEQSEKVTVGHVINAGSNYGYSRILPIDFSEYFDYSFTPSPTQIDELSALYIKNNNIGVPDTNWTINFVPLDSTEEYKDIARLETVSIGDTVKVRYKALGVDATSRVIGIVWNVLLDKYISVSLGSVKKTAAGTIVATGKKAASGPNTTDVKNISTKISQELTKLILGADGGCVRFLDTNNDGQFDTLYIADDPDPTVAKKVWRFNYEGWAASSNGYNGPFVIGATIDGVLNADILRVVSSGDVGEGYDDCLMTFDGQYLKGIHADSGGNTIVLGSTVDVSGNIAYVHGDFKMNNVKVQNGVATVRQIIWLGAEEGSNGLVIKSPDDNAIISLVYNSDIGMIIDMNDANGNNIFSLSEDGAGGTLTMANGTIRCKKLIVNGVEITR